MIIDLAPLNISDELCEIVHALCAVSIKIAYEISLGGLDADLNAFVGENAGGDGQKALDVTSDEKFASALKPTSVRHYASEEQDHVIELNPAGQYALAIDPLDGSSNIDANVSIGTIFSILPVALTPNASFLRAAQAQLVGGYFIYGPQTALVITAGDGTHQFIFDRMAAIFRYSGLMVIKPKAQEFAINASNHRHWPAPIRAYVDDCLAGKEGARGQNYNMRWIASLVAETHRILSRGGVFLYPSDARIGYEHGRLRQIYECAPIAFLVEQAGGKATNGIDPIMETAADTLHGRTGFVFGSSEEVDRIARYFDLPQSDVSPLFKNRSLFAS